MRKIQTKLQTPTGSTEHLPKINSIETNLKLNEESNSEKKPFDENSLRRNSFLEEKSIVQRKSIPQPQQEMVNKTVQCRGPPTINLGTWSERPKSQVSLKEDTDYKFNKKEKDSINSKLIVNTTNNNIVSNNTIEIRNNDIRRESLDKNSNTVFNVKINAYDGKNYHNSNNVCIKVNGSEPISTQHSGKVYIKIGNKDQKEKDLNGFSFEGQNEKLCRKPFGNVNKIEYRNSRPHSIAFGSEYLPPVVRSVEYKKPFMDLQSNKSITQIYATNTESQPNPNQIYINGERTRISNQKFTPVVKGFKNVSSTLDNSKKSWNIQKSYSTLPLKTNLREENKGECLSNYNKEGNFSTNTNVPFSKSNLRRTESTKTNLDEENEGNGKVFFDKVVLRSTKNVNGLNRHSMPVNSGDVEEFNRAALSNQTDQTYQSVQVNQTKQVSQTAQARKPITTYQSVQPNQQHQSYQIPHQCQQLQENQQNQRNVQQPKPPQPPPMLKPVVNVQKPRVVNNQIDPRSELLKAIREFGGKQGLRSVKG